MIIYVLILLIVYLMVKYVFIQGRQNSPRKPVKADCFTGCVDCLF